MRFQNILMIEKGEGNAVMLDQFRHPTVLILTVCGPEIPCQPAGRNSG